MKSKLYKLAIWYIAKCNSKWNKRKFADDLKSLDRLTYWNFGKYMLVYGADAEWRIFSRYEVLDNAIQKLAKYENKEQEIRTKAIDEFAELMKERVKDIQFAEFQGIDVCPCAETGEECPYINQDIGCQYCAREHTIKDIDEIAEEMKAGGDNV